MQITVSVDFQILHIDIGFRERAFYEPSDVRGIARRICLHPSVRGAGGRGPSRRLMSPGNCNITPSVSRRLALVVTVQLSPYTLKRVAERLAA